LVLAAAACATTLACLPTDVCGCTPLAPTTWIEGSVRTEEGSPIPGVAIFARSLPPDCPDFSDIPINPWGVSDTDGAYRVLIYGTFAGTGPATCAEIVAVRTVGMTADTLTVHEVVDVAVPEPPSVALDLVFPS
jgi:hypothetical protein